ncbi:ATP-binding protein [Microvirga massiliensis]|uniref:ATP-binding protein n=1 Tax=Microvirga massiliensis TaxID=1033741 RepID=UPI000660263D|nr:winged helix-turn-helix domain-containing protein [Microvirga massiliensis]
MSSKTPLSIIDHDQSAGEGTDPRPASVSAVESHSAATPISFGPFRRSPMQRLLLQDNQPVHIGSRALDILIALLERPGDLVEKNELMARVWPKTFVEPGNLTVHITALRRVLGDGRDGNRFLINIPGRGYRFVAPVTVSDQFKPSLPVASVTGWGHNLPARVTRLIGRSDIVARLSAQITRDRFFTVVGPGGIGKTAVALAVAGEVAATYRDGTWWIDLAARENPRHVADAVASVLGLELDREKSPANLVTALRDKQMLLVLDTCEHAVAAAADLVATILRDAPGVHVLATSREPLHTEGEQLCRLGGLESPPAHCTTAEQAHRFPAVELFLERTAASIGEFALSDADAAAASDICDTLDGFPLAIELAAHRVGSLGIAAVAAELKQPLRLLTAGYRTGPARQQTIRAALDWSHGLLTDQQQIMLRRLSVFSGEFTLQDAAGIVSDQARPDCPMVDKVAELVSQSLITSEVRETQPRFRLSHVTRAYALEKLEESGDLDAIARRLSDNAKVAIKRPSAAPMLNGAPSAVAPHGKERSPARCGTRYVAHPMQRRERGTLQYRRTVHVQ